MSITLNYFINCLYIILSVIANNTKSAWEWERERVARGMAEDCSSLVYETEWQRTVFQVNILNICIFLSKSILSVLLL